jgi:hypothetical protein
MMMLPVGLPLALIPEGCKAPVPDVMLLNHPYRLQFYMWISLSACLGREFLARAK